MPRIINAYDGNSALGTALGNLGESLYGDGAKYEVYRQKARGEQNINDLAADGTVGLDDPRLAKAQLAIGGTAGGTFAGQGRSLANDRSIAGGHDATSRANNAATNAETHYGTDRRYDSDIATTGMNNANRITTTGMNNDTQRDIELTRDARATQGVLQPDGSVLAYQKSDANAQHLPMPQSTDQLKAGVTAMILRRANQASAPPASPFNDGAPAWNAGAPQPVAAPQPAPQRQTAPAGTVNAGMYGSVTPQQAAFIGQPRQAMIHPATGKTGYSYDNGATLADGSQATGFIPATDAEVMAAEKANNIRAAAAAPLPPRPEGFSQYAQDAYTAGGPAAAIQHDVNAISGLAGQGEVGANTNRARENLTNTNNAVRGLLASAPGSRAAVYREKNANRAMPEADGFMGITGINAEQQRNKAVSEITHLRNQYALVQADATNPQTPPEEAAKMLSWLHAAKDAITSMEQPQAAAPTAGAKPAAAPAAPAAPAQPAPPQGGGDPLAQARAAIQQGANPAAVKQRLMQHGIDPSGL